MPLRETSIITRIITYLSGHILEDLMLPYYAISPILKDSASYDHVK